ncbi:unnamed protein product [Haemonchus placei]|uniref:DUF2645 family protein n=1 Tax=Haemonchus placei TaxID=6290 RepID=A0A0N4WAA4_HAEPC|nr:unnamed protein product [Haemonchus placei]
MRTIRRRVVDVFLCYLILLSFIDRHFADALR